MTSTMRKQMEEERISKYPRVVIRVQFPDRLVLQGVFRPRETSNLLLFGILTVHIVVERRIPILQTQDQHFALNFSQYLLYVASSLSIKKHDPAFVYKTRLINGILQ